MRFSNLSEKKVDFLFIFEKDSCKTYDLIDTSLKLTSFSIIGFIRISSLIYFYFTLKCQIVSLNRIQIQIIFIWQQDLPDRKKWNKKIYENDA